LEFTKFRSNRIFNIADLLGGLNSLKELIFVDNPIKKIPPKSLRNPDIERITINNYQLGISGRIRYFG
jgi:Leucine-rich repeat (LRR) protein